jgi:hypothetical protein
MPAAPCTAVDLPLKMVWEDAGGHVWMSYNPEYLQERHGFPLELLANNRGR